MQIVCVREGRMGYHIGDVVTIPDDSGTIDETYFMRVPSVDPEVKKAADEKADAEASANASRAKKDAADAAAKLAADLAKNESETV